MKSRLHYADQYLPANPLTVNLIGAGGTGGYMLGVLTRLNVTSRT